MSCMHWPGKSCMSSSIRDRLPDEVGNIWVDDVVPESTRSRIVEKVTLLCQRQEEAQRAREK